MPARLLRITLAEPSPAVCAALAQHVTDAGLENVDVVELDALEVTADAVVSPGNSFGLMDGGIDLACVQRFGPRVAELVRREIDQYHHGELLVGEAVTVPTGDGLLPHLISAPTTRVPMRLPVHTANPYLATRAVILQVLHGRLTLADGRRIPTFERVSHVVTPGLGTRVGRVPAQIAARQMVAAISDLRDGLARNPTTWDQAVDAHRRLTASRP